MTIQNNHTGKFLGGRPSVDETLSSRASWEASLSLSLSLSINQSINQSINHSFSMEGQRVDATRARDRHLYNVLSCRGFFFFFFFFFCFVCGITAICDLRPLPRGLCEHGERGAVHLGDARRARHREQRAAQPQDAGVPHAREPRVPRRRRRRARRVRRRGARRRLPGREPRAAGTGTNPTSRGFFLFFFVFVVVVVVFSCFLFQCRNAGLAWWARNAKRSQVLSRAPAQWGCRRVRSRTRA